MSIIAFVVAAVVVVVVDVVDVVDDDDDVVVVVVAVVVAAVVVVVVSKERLCLFHLSEYHRYFVQLFLWAIEASILLLLMMFSLASLLMTSFFCSTFHKFWVLSSQVLETPTTKAIIDTATA